MSSGMTGKRKHAEAVLVGHPLGVQPLGNAHLEHGMVEVALEGRNAGLGMLANLDDALLLKVLGFVGAKGLNALRLCSRMLCALASEQDLWRALALELWSDKEPETPNYVRLPSDGCWREAYWRAATDQKTSAPFRKAELCLDRVFSDVLFHSYRCARMPVEDEWLCCDNAPTEVNLSCHDFHSAYGSRNYPVVLRGAVREACNAAPWSSLQNECNSELHFNAGGFPFTMSGYLEYASRVVDDQALYLFDKHFFDKCPDLAQKFQPPQYFEDDYFKYLGDDRPDYRWMIIGPERSGSTFHVDPNGTSAWNATMSGSKKWFMLPSHLVPPGVHPSEDGSDVTGPVSPVEWCTNFLAEARETHGRSLVECTTQPGDVVFVPSGWWHLVMNLETPTVAITQNFVDRHNLRSVLQFLRQKPSQVSGMRDQKVGGAELADRLLKAVEEKSTAADEKSTYIQGATRTRQRTGVLFENHAPNGTGLAQEDGASFSFDFGA